jgi:hypothetical protein
MKGWLKVDSRPMGLENLIKHLLSRNPPSSFGSHVIVLKESFCCGQQLTQKLEITLEASELEPITQQLTQNLE